jgi:hypothetical protein
MICRRTYLLGTAAVAAALASPVPAAGGAPALEAPTVAFLATPGTRLDDAWVDRGAIARIRWYARRYATAGGESVDVRVSSSYGADPATAQQWADFFASLLHGPELGLLRAYVAPLDEVQELCHGDALGCYWANRLVMVGDSSGGIPPAAVAAHEYGHHVANNRINAPWRALDWGTKRWASHMNVCTRAAGGRAFPGDEGSAYELNPGEAFAESYRVLNERERGIPFTWPIVDPSFIPDEGALEALRQDVVTPWTGTTTRTIRARFSTGRRVWARRLATPLDGQLDVASPGSSDVRLTSNGQSLARATWTGGAGGKSLAYQICGRRSVELRVVRDGGPRAVNLRLSLP